MAAALRFTTAHQLLEAAVRSVRAPLAEAASIVRLSVPGYSFEADVLFEEPDPKRQSELMEAVHSAKEEELLELLWVEDPRGYEVADAYSSGGPHAGDFLFPPSPSAPTVKVLTMPKDKFVNSLRTRLRTSYPSLLPRFRRELGPAQ